MSEKAIIDQSSPQGNKMKWDIWSFYKQSWKIAWHNKKLWILGIAAILYVSGGTVNFSSGGSSSKTSSQPTVSTSRQQTSSLTPPPIFKTFITAYHTLPSFVLPTLALEFIITLCAAVILRVIAQSWATAALIIGVQDAVEKKPIDLSRIARVAATRIKSVAWVSIIPIALTVLAISLCVAFIMILSRFSFMLTLVLACTLFVVSLGLLARVSLAIILALRFCSLEKLSGSDSFKKGMAASSGRVWKGMRLGTANSLLVWGLLLIALIPLGIFGFASLKPFFDNDQVHMGAFIPFALLLILFFTGLAVIPAIYRVFVYATWHFAYTFMSTDRKVKS